MSWLLKIAAGLWVAAGAVLGLALAQAAAEADEANGDR